LYSDDARKLFEWLMSLGPLIESFVEQLSQVYMPRVSLHLEAARVHHSARMICMKRRYFIGILVAAGLLAAGTLVVVQSKVSPQAIASSVTRTPELVERAWRLPVAAIFGRQLSWQSNGTALAAELVRVKPAISRAK
jgi:hypothetical protein